MQNDLVKKLYALADEWEEWAMSQVPEDYAKRNLHYKYLKCDNIAAGHHNCAEILRDLLDTASGLTTHGADERDGASRTREEEHARIEAQQIRDAMPLIGPLLDRWDDLPNDVKYDDELVFVKEAIERLDAAMEGPEE